MSCSRHKFQNRYHGKSHMYKTKANIAFMINISTIIINFKRVESKVSDNKIIWLGGLKAHAHKIILFQCVRVEPILKE